MSKKIVLLLLLSLLSFACSVKEARIDPKGMILIDPSMPTEVVLNALQAWERDTDGGVSLKPQISTDTDGPSISAGHMSPDRNAYTQYGFEGDPVRIIVDLDNIAYEAKSLHIPFEDVVQSVVMHELGHGFGLHEHEDNTLMQQYGFGGLKVDDRTLERWHSL